MQATALAILLCSMCLGLTQAEEVGTASVNVLPAGGKHQGIVLKTQTVDVVVSNQQGTVWADTEVWLRLQNPAAKVITVTVTLPGPQLFPAPLPPNLQMAVNDAPFALTKSNANGTEGESASGLIAIPARSSVDVRLTYRQALPERGGRDVYSYALSDSIQWAGNPQSLRMTVEFKPPLSTDQLSSPILPTPHRADAQSLTWDWEADWAKTHPSIVLAFMTPAWWEQYGAARAAAARDEAGAAEHLALARYYQSLASLPLLPFEAEGTYHTRYYPFVIAELRSAIAASTSLSDTVRARTLLAGVYRDEADRAEPAARVHYLQSAAKEIRSAMAGASSQDLIVLAMDVYTKLAQADGIPDNEYRAHLAQLRGSSVLEERDPQQSDQLLAAADQAMERGDLATARQLVVRAFGPAAAALPESPPPLANQSVINVIQTADGRVIGLTLEGGGNPQGVSDLITQTATAMGARVPGGIITDSDHLTLTLPFQDRDQLAQLQQTLVADLPPAPELALLEAVLSTAPIVSETATSPVGSTWRFEERLDLTGAADRWRRIADRLDAASGAGATPELPQNDSGGLAQLQHVLWTADAGAWRDMARNSRVQYLLSVEDPAVSRTWQIPASASRDLLVEVGRWDLQRLRWAPLLAAMLVIGGALLVWRLG